MTVTAIEGSDTRRKPSSRKRKCNVVSGALKVLAKDFQGFISRDASIQPSKMRRRFMRRGSRSPSMFVDSIEQGGTFFEKKSQEPLDATIRAEILAKEIMDDMEDLSESFSNLSNLGSEAFTRAEE